MPAPTGAVLAPVEGVPAVVTLRPGQIRFAKEPAVVRTVPGSCLSATMHCARPGAGAICAGEGYVKRLADGPGERR